MSVQDARVRWINGPHGRALASYIVFFVVLFLPALADDRWLAPGDGLVSYFPALYRTWSLWTENIYSGFPAIGDPQALLWYPLRYILPNYNALVISAYVVAAMGTYGFTYRRVGDFYAALIAGFIYGGGGFMMAHLGHLTIIHAAAWIPLIIWSLDELARRPTARWFAIGAASVSLCFLGGHPQILLYGLILAGAFSAYRILASDGNSVRRAVRLSAIYLGVVAVGMALSAIQLLPFLELRSLSARNALWSYSDFASFSLPREQLPLLFFPYFFGASGLDLPAYFGMWNLAELAIYAGVTSYCLAAVALVARGKGSDALFWSGTALAAVLIASAGSTPLGRLLFEVPLFGDFRCLGRMAFVFIFAIAVLAATGLARIRRSEVSAGQIVAAVGAVNLIVVLTLLYSTQGFYDSAAAANVPDARDVLGKVVMPSLAFLALVSVLLVWLRNRVSAGHFALALTALVALDMWSSAHLLEWRFGPPRAITEMVDSRISKLEAELDASQGRLMPLFEPTTPVFPLTAALNDYFDIPSAGGYGPLMPSAYASVMGFRPDMALARAPSDNVLVAAGITHLAYATAPVSEIAFGGCGADSRAETILGTLPTSVRATTIRIVSNTSCSVGLPTGRQILELGVRTRDGERSVEMQMGRDTAEWAFDRPDVRPAVQHTRPAIESSFAADGADGHYYVTEIKLSELPVEVDGLRLEFPADTGAGLKIRSLELVDASTGAVAKVDIAAMRRSASSEVQFTLDNGIEIARYTKTKGPAWLVAETRNQPVELAVVTLQQGRWPDGGPFDAATAAIVTGGEEINGLAGAARRVKRIVRTPEEWRLETSSPDRAFLVISQSFHPGWKVYVNGKRERLHQTNAAFQGVYVPAGDSEVRLVFQPISFLIGGVVSALAVLMLLICLAFSMSRERRSDQVATAMGGSA